ncbi:MAG: ABC transporter ATP-binding protein [Hyphomicrobiales bacterium]|jgi:peptide/nickel transport system ATP-binding protein
MSEIVVTVENLDLSLPEGGDRPFATKGVSYNVEAGKVLCIVGESGSGKSMSANAIMGLLPPLVKPTGGRILFEGQDLLSLDEAAMRSIRGARIGMIFQEPMSALNPLMRIGEQIAEVFEAHRSLPQNERKTRALELLSEVGLPDPEATIRAYPFQLSGGQRQRVMIAMALALEPKLLIADEPTTALDVTTQAQILELIRQLRDQRGTAVLFITHDFGVVADIADYVCVMQQGRVVEYGPVGEVLYNPSNDYTKSLIDAIPKMQRKNADEDITRPPLLQVNDLRKTYHTSSGIFGPTRVVHAVDKVSFDIAQGETLGIVGESGSGKSSLGRCIIRLMQPDAGTIRLDDVDISALNGGELRRHRRLIQMIFQDPYGSLNPRTKVGRIVADGLIAAGRSKASAMARSRELLELVGLGGSAADRYPHEFSGGQRQRIGIARALALDPRLIIADEAVSALDVTIQAQVLELLAELKKKFNLSLLFITHDLRVAAQICDRIAVMQNGRIVEIGSVNEVFFEPKQDYTKKLLAAMPGTNANFMASAERNPNRIEV